MPRSSPTRGALLVVDGGFGYGQVIGTEAMAIAAARAKANGFCAVAIRNSGHLGRIGAWAEHARRGGPHVLPFRQYVGLRHPGRAAWRQRPPAFRQSARGRRARSRAAGRFVLDIATSVVAEGKIQVARNKGETLPPGLVLDGAGRPTTDPAAFYARPAGRDLSLRRPQGIGPLLLLRDPGRLAHRRLRSSHPKSPTAGRLVNNMLSLAFDPAAFGGTELFDGDVKRLIAWAKASPPSSRAAQCSSRAKSRTGPGGAARDGIPIDAETFASSRTPWHSLRPRRARGASLSMTAMRTNPVREKLRRGEAAFGIMACEFFTPGLLPDRGQAGAEFVLFDQEHGARRHRHAQGADRLRPRRRRRPLRPRARPRLPPHRAGARCGRHGIMVPMIETRAQAEASPLVPLPAAGVRGLGFGVGHDDYSRGDVVEKMQAANERTLVIALIETATGIDNADAILAVPGIDVGWLGHYDLTNTMGIAGDFTHHRFADAVGRLLAACERHGKAADFLATNLDQAREWRAKGFRCLGYGTDVGLFRDEFSGAIAMLKADEVADRQPSRSSRKGR